MGEDPKVPYRLSAAGGARMAAAGRGQDAATLDDAERARLRRQALDWLKADLAACGRRADLAADRPTAHELLRRWQNDPDLSSVRDAEALTKLPDAERAAWQTAWADVMALQKRCESPPAAAKPATAQNGEPAPEKPGPKP